MLTGLNSIQWISALESVSFQRWFEEKNELCSHCGENENSFYFFDRLIKCLCVELKWSVKSRDQFSKKNVRWKLIWIFRTLNLQIFRFAISFTQMLILQADSGKFKHHKSVRKFRLKINNHNQQGVLFLSFFTLFMQSSMTWKTAIEFWEKYYSKVHTLSGEKLWNWHKNQIHSAWIRLHVYVHKGKPLEKICLYHIMHLHISTHFH